MVEVVEVMIFVDGERGLAREFGGEHYFRLNSRHRREFVTFDCEKGVIYCFLELS